MFIWIVGFLEGRQTAGNWAPSLLPALSVFTEQGIISFQTGGHLSGHLESEAVAQISHEEHRDISFRIGSGAEITSL